MTAVIASICGYSRSGSTVLDLLLGQLPGFFSTGELAYLWRRGVQENRLCGCGRRFLDCPFWTRVGRCAFGAWTAEQARDVVRLQRAVARHRDIPLLLGAPAGERWHTELERYLDILRRLYGAIEEVSGSTVIVDSTIEPTHGFVLRRMRAPLRVIHLVRDSRGTAYSWTKRRRRPDAPEGSAELPRYRPASSALRWNADHLLTHLLGGVSGGELVLTYEGLMRRPAAELRRVGRFLGVDVSDVAVSFLDPPSARLRPNHTVAGSGVRLRAERIELRLDDEWRRAMPESDKRTVTALTLPLLVRYGYLTARVR